MLSIGLMSGTSMDGIDASLIETDGSENLIKDLGHIFIAYTNEFKILLKAAEYTIRNCNGDMNCAESNYYQSLGHYLKNELTVGDPQRKIEELLHYLCLDARLKKISLDDVIQHSTQLHREAVKKLLEETGYDAKQIDVIGYHGQTMFHQPTMKLSIVIGNGRYLADELGITVVNQFRSQDIAAGGQGAPFAPLYHQALAIRDNKIPVAVVNCGGIANITIINGSGEDDLMAFDTGPGNGLIDRFVRQRTNGKENMDEDGKYGKNGIVHQDVLTQLYEKSIIKSGKNYFAEKPPKSLDIGDMLLISELNQLTIEDGCTTLEAFTAATIVDSLQLLNVKLPQHWILAGGGWHNPVMRHELDQRLKKNFGNAINILTADKVGWNTQALESQIFAYHAVRSLMNKPLSVPNTTRVPFPISGGHAYVPSSGATKVVAQLIQQNPAVLTGYRREE